jgi:hypothetical protein
MNVKIVTEPVEHVILELKTLVSLVMLQDISTTTIVLKSALMDSTTKKNQENVHHVIHLV